MKGDNPPHQFIPLYCTQPSPTQLDYEAEAELHYFPPVREGNSAPLTPSISACYSPPCSQPAQETTNDSDESDFPSIKEGNNAPLVPIIPGRSHPHRPQAAQRGSQQISSYSKDSEEPSQSQRHQQPNIGLGRANIVNTVNAIVPAQAKSSLKRDSEIQDAADERPSKKRCVAFRDEDNMRAVWHEIASLRESVEKVAAEARDINSTLQELLCETRRKPLA